MNNYLDIKEKVNPEQFDRYIFFNQISNLLGANYPLDDIKGNVYMTDYSGDGDFKVTANLSWIFYPEDVPKADMKKIASNIEKLINETFDINDATVTWYKDSEHSDHGYDVDLNFIVYYEKTGFEK